MNLSLLSLMALTLLVCGAVASVPEIAISRPPRSQPPADARHREDLWIVQAPGDRWYLAGRSISREALQRAVRRSRGRARLHLLASATLPVGEIAASLDWLRFQAGTPVHLQLPPRP